MRPASLKAPLLLVLVIWLDDLVIDAVSWPVPLLGPLDWVAHLSTTALCLLALAPMRLLGRTSLVVWVLVCSCAIDLDHLVLYLHLAPGVHGGRPGTHSLTTVVVLALLAATAPRARALLLGAALGVTLHFVRDSATGGGIPFWWPFSSRMVLLPYHDYAVLLVFLAVIATTRVRRDRLPPHHMHALRR